MKEISAGRGVSLIVDIQVYAPVNFVPCQGQTAKAILRDYINATITFEGLAKKIKKSGKSIHRMLGPRGNPRADNILEIIKILQAHEHITLRVKVNRIAA